MPSLAGFPTVWMACGNSHSVVIGAGGDALGFGLNTHGQVSRGRLDFFCLGGVLLRRGRARRGGGGGECPFGRLCS